MERRQGRPRLQYEGVGRTISGPNMPLAAHRGLPRPNGGLAKGIVFDLF
jgi:hypothetical protein